MSIRLHVGSKALGLLLASSSFACAASDQGSPASTEEALAPAIAKCEAGVLTAGALAAANAAANELAVPRDGAPLASDPALAPVIKEGELTNLRLVPGDSPGLFVGRFRLQTDAVLSEYALFVSNPSAPISVTTTNGVGAPCGRALTDALTLGLIGEARPATLRAAYVLSAPASESGTYLLDIGPTTATGLRFFFVRQRPRSLLSFGATGKVCEPPSAALCGLAEAPAPLTAHNLGSTNPPALSAGSVRGVQLVTWQGHREGVLVFTPETTGFHSVYTSRPNVGLVVRRESEAPYGQTPLCVASLADEGCKLRSAQSYLLHAGVRYRIEFEPPPNVSYVRVAINRDDTETCRTLYEANPTAPDGVYPLRVRGTAFAAYCLMSQDGGGWTQIAGYPPGPDTPPVPSGWALGADVGSTFIDPNALFKMSDATIDLLRSQAYRVRGVARQCSGDPSCSVDVTRFWRSICRYSSATQSGACSQAFLDADFTTPAASFNQQPCPQHRGLTDAICGSTSTIITSHDPTAGEGLVVCVGEPNASPHACNGRGDEQAGVQIWVR